MASKNDGLGMGPEFWAPLPGQDRKHSPLGTSKAVPGPNYFADVRGLDDEQEIRDAVAGLSDPKQIEAVLTELLGPRLAREFMWFRLKMRENAPRP
jgi:hypothetical protein